MAAERDRTAILNGFGRSLGDSVIGLQALSLALEAGALPARPVLFRLPGLAPLVQQTYALAADLAEVRDLPWSAATPDEPFAPGAGFATVIDMRDYAFDPAFRATPMIDYFLRHLGLDPDTVAPARRRNTWLAPRLGLAAVAVPAQPLGGGRTGTIGSGSARAPTATEAVRVPAPPGTRTGVTRPPAGAEPGFFPPPAAGPVLICPRASMPLRDMPEAVHAAIQSWLDRAGLPWISQATQAPAATLAGLCATIAGSRAVISTDTAMVHLADALGVPCLAFFTTHRPEWRVRDYPLCRPVHLPADVPEALEFARHPGDIRAAHAAWFTPGADLAWLDPVLAAFLGD